MDKILSLLYILIKKLTKIELGSPENQNLVNRKEYIARALKSMHINPTDVL